MAEKDELNEIKKLMKEGKLVIGTNITLKRLKQNKLSKVWLSSNVPDSVRDDIVNYSKMNNVTVAGLSIPNSELGVLCKKQFFVSVASLAKGE